jgi:hypothetical protein
MWPGWNNVPVGGRIKEGGERGRGGVCHGALEQTRGELLGQHPAHTAHNMGVFVFMCLCFCVFVLLYFVFSLCFCFSFGFGFDGLFF